MAGEIHGGATELRVALTVEDLEGALRLYRDALGLEVENEWETGSGRGVVLAAGRATLELIDLEHAAFIDEVEAGRRVSGPVRLALAVGDVDATARRLEDAGARSLTPSPVETPWGDRNQRMAAPDGMQLTLFEAPAIDRAAG